MIEATETRNIEILKQVLKAINEEFLQPQHFTEILQGKQNSADQMVLSIYDLGVNLKQLGKIASGLFARVKDNDSFAQWVMPSFVSAWIKINIINEIGNLKANVIKQLLAIKPCWGYDTKLEQYMKEISQKMTKIKQFQNQDWINQYIQITQTSEQFKTFSLIIERKLSNQVQICKNTNQDEKQQDKKLNQMIQAQKQMKNSVIDQLFQENLIQAYRQKINKTKKEYSKQRYEQFKKIIIEKTKQFGIYSYEFQKQLELPLRGDTDYYDKIINLRAIIHPIFVPELMALIEKNNVAKNIVKDKDIVVILGVSGAGKSTCVQVMLGYKLKEYSSNKQLTTLVPVGGLKKEHRQFVASASTNSVTKHISIIQLDEQRTNNQQIYLADTPGFFDTGGLIIETSNSLSTIKALAQANSIRFILLVNERNDQNRSGFKKLAKIISRLFKTYDKQKFIYFLNRYNDEQLRQLPIKMKKIKESLSSQQKGDNRFCSVINHFTQIVVEAQQLANKKKISIREAFSDSECKQAFVLDPIKPNIKQLYKKILNKELKITNPKNVLQNILSQESRSALENESNNLQVIIRNSVKNNKYETVFYYMEQLSKLVRETKQCNDPGKASIKLKNIKYELENQHRKSFQIFEKDFQLRIQSLKLNQQDFINIKKAKENILNLQKNYKKILLLSQITVQKQINQLIEDTANRLIQATQKEPSEALTNTIILFDKYFGNNLKQRGCDIITQQIKGYNSSILLNIENKTFQNLQDYIFCLNALLQRTRALIPENLRNSNNNKWREKLDEKIQSLQRNFNKIIEKDNDIQIKLISQEQLKDLQQIINICSKVKNTKIVELQKIQNCYKIFTEKLIKLTKKYIADMAKFRTMEDINMINKNVNNVAIAEQNAEKLIQKIKQVKGYSANQLEIQKMNLIGMIRSNRQIISNRIQSLENVSAVSVKEIYDSICRLRSMLVLIPLENRQECINNIDISENKLQCTLQSEVNQMKNGIISYKNANKKIGRIIQNYKLASILLENAGITGIKDEQQKKEKMNKTIQICYQLREQSKKSIDTILDSIKSFADNELKQCQNNHLQIASLRQKEGIEKIKVFFEQIQYVKFYPSEINQSIRSAQKIFEDELEKCLNQFERKIKKLIDQLATLVDNKQLKKQDVRQIISYKLALTRLLEDNKMKEIIQSKNMNLCTIEKDFYYTISDIQAKIKHVFQQKKDASSRYELLEIFHCLRYLDSYLSPNQQKFSQILQYFRSELDITLKDYNKSVEEILNHQKQLQIQLIKKYYNHFSEMKSQDYKKKLNQFSQRLNYITKRKSQKNLKQIKILVSKNQNIQNSLTDFNQLSAAIQQLNSFLREEHKISLDVRKDEDVVSCIKKIISEAVAKFKKCINKGSTWYQEALKYIKQIRNLQISSTINNLKDIQTFFQEQKKAIVIQNKLLEDSKNLGLSELMEMVLEEKKKSRKRIFENQIKQINQQLLQVFQTIQEKDKKQIRKEVIKYFQNRLTNVVQLSNQQLKNLYSTLDKQKQKLPRNFKQQLKPILEEQKVSISKERQRKRLEAQTKFVYKQAIIINQQQISPFQKQIYEKIIQNYLNKKKNEIQQSKFENAQQIKKISQQTLCEQQKIKNIVLKQNYQEFKKILCLRLEDVINKKYLFQFKNYFINTTDKKSQPEEKWEEFKKTIKDLDKIFNIIQDNIKEINIDLEKFKKVMKQVFQNQICNFQKLSQITIQTQSKKKRQFLPLFRRYKIFKNADEQFKKYPILHKIMEQTGFQKIKQQIESSLQIIEEKVENLTKQYKQLNLYTQNTRGFSKQQKKAYIQQAIKKRQMVLNLQSFNQFLNEQYQYDYKNIVKQKQISLKDQIEGFIKKSTVQIEKAFKDAKLEFSFLVNFIIQLVEVLYEYKLIHLEEKKSEHLVDVITKGYADNIAQIDHSSKKILDQKLKLKARVDQIVKNNLQQRKKRQEQIDQKSKNKENGIYSQYKIRLQKQGQSLAQKWQQNELALLTKEIDEQKQSIGKQMQQKIKDQTSNEQKQLDNAIQNFCNYATVVYKATVQISYNKKQYRDKLDSMLINSFQQFGRKINNKIYQVFMNCKNTYSAMITNQYDTFKTNFIIKWEAKVKGMSLERVLKEMNISQHKKKWVLECYNSYKSELDFWINQFQKHPTNAIKDRILQPIKIQSQNMKKYYHESGQSKYARPEKLIAQIFALWIIQNSSIQDDVAELSFQPHPAQIICIFLCLSLKRQQNQPTRQIISKMAQVGTGEGKSVILAGLSCYFALCGFQVSCACYSNYLSSRDRKNFAQLFDILQVSDKIKYGTFDQICQSLLNQQTRQYKGLRQQVKNILIGKEEKLTEKFKKMFKQIFNKKIKLNNQKQNKKILLIDEFDIFFDPTLFGSLYRPSSCLNSPQIKALIKHVWNCFSKNRNITQKLIIKSEEFKKVVEVFPKIEKILTEQIKGMIFGCRECDHNYVIKDNLIKYKNQDTYSDKISYGYHTIFAYLKEHQKGNITLHSMENALKINLVIAQFSYAELPNFFKAIIGVTGTYDDMPQFQQSFLKNTYKVQDVFIIPSVYGSDPQGERRLCNIPKLLPPEQLWKEVANQVKSVHETGRPVLVFFNRIGQLQSFFNSQHFASLQHKTSFLNQTHPEDDRDQRIKKTCLKNRITLMTRSFARGTDFKTSFDQSILSIGHGGLHVIQTFISAQKSQQTQIKGRTARQGDKGSYSLIASIQDLQIFQIKAEEIQKFKDVNKFIETSRNRLNQKLGKAIISQINNAQELHKRSYGLYTTQNLTEDDIIKFILDLNTFPSVSSPACKTVILMDATASMGEALIQLKGMLSSVVDEVTRLAKKYKANTSYLQIGVYRNYNVSYESLFEVTAFEVQASNLIEFIKTIQPNGGMGNQAIQVAFRHVNSLHEVNQVIIIGDAAANSNQQTKIKRQKMKGQQYWTNEKGLPILSAQDELNQIKSKNIPIHSFYIGADDYFKYISRQTKGRCKKFQIRSPNAPLELQKFISQRILQKLHNDEKIIQLMKNQYKPRRMH